MAVLKKALYYKKTGSGMDLQCLLCPQSCVIHEGRTGSCGVRMNSKGILRTSIHHRITSAGMDPIEKKPLFHFHPDNSILSVGTAGCNLHCSFCQNWETSQNPDHALREISPETMLKSAIENRSLGIAFTYNEPTIWIETVLETARLFKENNLKNVLVTNGFINRKPLEDLLPYIDAMNIDVKAFTDDFYKENCKGKLSPVMDNIEFIHRTAPDSVHIELTMLIIPGLNDSRKDTGRFVDWVASMDKSIPVHFSAYHPAYQMTIRPTPAETMLAIWSDARKKLDYVYTGNMHIAGGEDTICPSCGNTLIKRHQFKAVTTGLKGNICAKCGSKPANLVLG